jgi:hypothetical protein
LLPILLASENDLYRNDNLQKLALRLRIAERDLILWAREQQEIAASKPPRQLELPPDAVSLGDEPPDFDTPRPDRRGQPGGANLREAALEAYVLRLLLRQPALIYDVSRKLRELAGDNPALAEGPLSDLSPNDFTRTSYRALMDQFVQAISQDEMAPRDYLAATLQADLLDEVEILLADEWEDLRPRLRHGLSADLMIVIKQMERFNGAVDTGAEIVDKALRLRRARLERERQEMVFLEMDGDTPNGDALLTGAPAGDTPYQTHIMLSILAKRLIDTELNHRSQALRQ